MSAPYYCLLFLVELFYFPLSHLPRNSLRSRLFVNTTTTTTAITPSSIPSSLAHSAALPQAAPLTAAPKPGKKHKLIRSCVDKSCSEEVALIMSCRNTQGGGEDEVVVCVVVLPEVLLKGCDER